MTTPDANPASWFSTAQRAMQRLRDRRRRAFVGESATAATRASVPSDPGPGGGGGGPGGGGGGTGPTTSTGTSTLPLPYTIAEQLIAGSAGAATGAAASVASVTAATGTPHGMAPLSGLGAIVAQVRRCRRGFVDADFALGAIAVLAFGVAVSVAVPMPTPAQPAGYADGTAARVTVAPDGFALAGWPDSLAIATGPTCGSIATQGHAFAAVPGATATAYAPAHAAGVPGSLLVLIGTRPDGSRVGVIVRPTTTPGVARAWTWYTLTNGALAAAGEVSEEHREIITNAQQGAIP